MTDATDIDDLDAQGLDEFAELFLASARDLAAKQLATDDPAQSAVLASALHKVGRSYRQTLALKARLRRDREVGRRETEDRAVKAERQRRELRKSRVQAAVARLIWTEGSDEAEHLTDELTDWLDEEILAEDFGCEPLEAHIERICQILGVVPTPAPEPDPADNDADDGYWRSSA